MFKGEKMAIQAVQKAINALVNQGRRNIKIEVEECPEGYILRGTAKTYYEKQLALEAAKKAAGQGRICAKNVEVT